MEDAVDEEESSIYFSGCDFFCFLEGQAVSLASNHHFEINHENFVRGYIDTGLASNKKWTSREVEIELGKKYDELRIEYMNEYGGYKQFVFTDVKFIDYRVTVEQDDLVIEPRLYFNAKFKGTVPF